MTDSNRELLQSIDAKLGGILVLIVDLYLRETGLAKSRPRSIDKALSDVGLSSAQIAALLGKTERAVQKQLSQKKAR